MALVNFRAVIDRFRHIDGRYVGCDVRFTAEAAEAAYVVRFYPWWEHPAYREAIASDGPWGFADTEAGERDVTVRAIRPVAARLSARADVTDWAFVERHPLLWQFEPLSHLFINAPFDARDLFERVMQRALPYVTRPDLAQFVDPCWKEAPSRGVQLPPSLCDVIESELAAMRVETFCSRGVQAQDKLVVFLVDDEDYIVAEDFEIDVPEFVHDPSWFRPQQG